MGGAEVMEAGEVTGVAEVGEKAVGGGNGRRWEARQVAAAVVAAVAAVVVVVLVVVLVVVQSGWCECGILMVWGSGTVTGLTLVPSGLICSTLTMDQRQWAVAAATVVAAAETVVAVAVAVAAMRVE